MKIHPSDLPLLPPSTCALCEQSPFEGEVVVDVERNFNTPDLEFGRKYVCSDCAQNLAELHGFMGPKEAFELEGRVAKAEEAARVAADVDELKKSVDEFIKEVKGFHVDFGAEPVSEPKKARAAAAKKK